MREKDEGLEVNEREKKEEERWETGRSLKRAVTG